MQHEASAERWVSVASYEGRYSVSNLGNVWSHVTERILKPAPNSRGYLCVGLYDGSRPKNQSMLCVHDLVAKAFIGPKPKGMQVDHVDCNKKNNCSGNLEYVTPLENSRRAIANGIRPKVHRGCANYRSTLKPHQVIEIRALNGTIPHTAIGKIYGINKSTVQYICKGKTYKDVG